MWTMPAVLRPENVMVPDEVMPVAAVIAPLELTAKAPEAMLSEPPWRAAVVVMLLPVEMVPKPEAIEPEARAPVPVIALKVPLCRLLLVILPLTMAEPLYCITSPLFRELRVRVVPCKDAMVGFG